MGGFTFVNNGTIMGIDDFVETVAREIAPAIVQAFSDRRLAAGV